MSLAGAILPGLIFLLVIWVICLLGRPRRPS
jgi:hypothetical protein